jgi:hypothetical protein
LPRTVYASGYPDWLNDTDSFFYPVDLPKAGVDSAFLQVYTLKEYKSESSNAIPVIQFTTSPGRNNYPLYLRKGRYYMALTARNGKPLIKKRISVK